MQKLRDNRMSELHWRLSFPIYLHRRLVFLPYEERIVRQMKKHQVTVTMRPVKTLKTLLMHPRDKQEEEITDCVYKISCASCEKCYIGASKRK